MYTISMFVCTQLCTSFETSNVKKKIKIIKKNTCTRLKGVCVCVCGGGYLYDKIYKQENK